jgi:aldose 1-epimerase
VAAVTTHPSGEQWTIAHAGHEVTVVEVGGGLRRYAVDGVDVLAGYGADDVCTSGRGHQLMPWPNRIRDGRYSFEGRSHQLPLTEPARHNASHGLVRWAAWRLAGRRPESLTVRFRLLPQPGWDGALDLETTYRLGDDGLDVEVSATNVGASPVPFGFGAHPYIALGRTPMTAAHLDVPATHEVRVDDRLIPTSTQPSRPEVDFTTSRPLGDTRLDTAYTGLRRAADGRWAVTVSGLAEDGRADAVTVWGDESFDWVQVFTPPLEDPQFVGSPGIAVEPMSCPADAFNSGDGLVVLEPGASWAGTWGISPGAR